MGNIPNPNPDRPGPRTHWGRSVLVAVGIASLFGLVQASGVVLATSNFGRPVPWRAALANSLVDSWLWVALVPPLFQLSRRFPLGHPRWPRNLAVHVAGALVAATTYSTALAVTYEWMLPSDLQTFRFMRGPKPPPEPGRDRHARDLTEPARTEPGRPYGRGGPSPGPGPGAGAGPDPGRGWPPEPPPFPAVIKTLLTTRWHLHIVTYVMIVGAWHWLAQQRRLRERERQTQELSRQLTEARLQALRMQLNPHFLFNTLNAIATLVHRDPLAADEMIACLSDFLRRTLSAPATPETPLRTELEFARLYLEIEKARFGDRLRVVEDIDPGCLEAPVPTLLLQPLLENAIHHGIERSERPGELRLEARSPAGTNQLVLHVIDSGPGLVPESKPRNGVGLANTRARLRELYGSDALFALNNREGGGVDVEIRLPLRRVPASGQS